MTGEILKVILLIDSFIIIMHQSINMDLPCNINYLKLKYAAFCLIMTLGSLVLTFDLNDNFRYLVKFALTC